MYNKQKTKDFGPAVASGLICGDSLWGISTSILALPVVKAPFCLKQLCFISIAHPMKLNL
ncbi:hypothetical protein H5410_028499 [Solanum commersonii]|uniref:Uncharacterized protein n=1 Tax=Solanum commersonii TaxID=4109 RepID=A0A9J5Z535_SOLCO|nr:hypothetical protein H5410_028499 [Solanum commersonii]